MVSTPVVPVPVWHACRRATCSMALNFYLACLQNWDNSANFHEEKNKLTWLGLGEPEQSLVPLTDSSWRPFSHVPAAPDLLLLLCA